MLYLLSVEEINGFVFTEKNHWLFDHAVKLNIDFIDIGFNFIL